MRTPLTLTALLSASAFAYVDWTTSIMNGTTCIDNFPMLLDADLDVINAGLNTALFTSVDLVKAYIARIKEVNDVLHVVNELNPDALAIAADLDAKRNNGTNLGPLHGIPILLKDNIATDDRLNNTAGSYVLVGAKAPRDSTIASKLRKAGAIILGKANLGEWNEFRSTNVPPGWSAYGGQSKGAYVENQAPGNGSSGSAIASALGLAFAAIGTETMGSIVLPAALNNVVGIKPTVGLTSRYLILPVSERQDTVGPIAKSVRDAAYVLQTIAGVDERDNYTSSIPGSLTVDYVAACKETALTGVRIGVPYNVLDLYANRIDSSLLAAFEQAIKDVEAAGAIVVEANFTQASFEAFQTDKNNSLVLQADFLTGLPEYLGQLVEADNLIKDLTDVEKWTKALQTEDYSDKDTAIWDAALRAGIRNTDSTFWEAYQASYYYGADSGVLGALSRNNVSALLLPTQFSFELPAIIGSPIITVPMGAYDNSTAVTQDNNLLTKAPGIPFGVAFLGKHWSEADLIGYAFAYEQKTNHRAQVLPYLAPVTQLVNITNATAYIEPTFNGSSINLTGAAA